MRREVAVCLHRQRRGRSRAAGHHLRALRLDDLRQGQPQEQTAGGRAEGDDGAARRRLTGAGADGRGVPRGGRGRA